MVVLMIDLQKKVKFGVEVLNFCVVLVDGQLCLNLLDFVKKSRLLVVNFGSCICFFFMDRLRDFNEIMVDFRDIVDFVVIYIFEVYFLDGWVFKVIIKVKIYF